MTESPSVPQKGFEIIPKRTEAFAKNITTTLHFGKSNHLEDLSQNCVAGANQRTLAVTVWKRFIMTFLYLLIVGKLFGGKQPNS